MNRHLLGGTSEEVHNSDDSFHDETEGSDMNEDPKQ